MKRIAKQVTALVMIIAVLTSIMLVPGLAASANFALVYPEGTVTLDGTEDKEITLELQATADLNVISLSGDLGYNEDGRDPEDWENAYFTLIGFSASDELAGTSAGNFQIYPPDEVVNYGEATATWSDGHGVDLLEEDAAFIATYRVNKDTPEGTYTISTSSKFKTREKGAKTITQGFTATITVTRVAASPKIDFVAVNPNDSTDKTEDEEAYQEDMPIPEVMPNYEYYDRTWKVNGDDAYTATDETLDAVIAQYIADHPEAETIEVDAVYTRQTYQVTLNANVNGAETSIYTTDNYEVGHSVRLVAPATYEGGAFGYWIVKDVPYYDTNGELAYKDMQYDNRDMTFVSVAPSRNGGPFEAYAYYGVQSQAEFPLSLRIANQYGEIASGNHKIVMTLELTAPEKVTAVGFLYTTDQDAMGEGPTIGMWNAKTSGTVAKKGAGTYTLRLNVGQATEKEVAVCAYVIYKGKTYYASTGGMAAEGAHGDCYDVLTWDALAN